MKVRPLDSASVEDANYEPLTELPPFCEFLPGSSEFTIAQIIGDEGEPGSVAVVKFAEGGLLYLEMPMASSAYVLDGALNVTSDDVSFPVTKGSGFHTPENWTGAIEATEPVTLILHV